MEVMSRRPEMLSDPSSVGNENVPPVLPTTGIWRPFVLISSSLPKHCAIAASIVKPRQSKTPISRYCPSRDKHKKTMGSQRRTQTQYPSNSKHPETEKGMDSLLVIGSESHSRTNDRSLFSILETVSSETRVAHMNSQKSSRGVLSAVSKPGREGEHT